MIDMTAPQLAQDCAKYLTEFVSKALKGESSVRWLENEKTGEGVAMFVTPANVGHMLDQMLQKMHTERRPG